MTYQFFAVHKYFRRHCNGAKFQPGFLGACQSRACKFFCVPARTAVIVIASVLSVLCIPGMRQRHRFAIIQRKRCSTVLPLKIPIFIHRDLSSHVHSSFVSRYVKIVCITANKKALFLQHRASLLVLYREKSFSE